MISARELRVRFGDREVLHGLTFDVRRGETLVVIGGSGSGKSTMLRTLVGLERPSSGQVRIGGVDISTAGARGMDAIRKRASKRQKQVLLVFLDKRKRDDERKKNIHIIIYTCSNINDKL
jgi:ABC-type transporter Mla maintaining outer membrane lipid asymmetry ATPase subunit MlaF